MAIGGVLGWQAFNSRITRLRTVPFERTEYHISDLLGYDPFIELHFTPEGNTFNWHGKTGKIEEDLDSHLERMASFTTSCWIVVSCNKDVTVQQIRDIDARIRKFGFNNPGILIEDNRGGRKGKNKRWFSEVRIGPSMGVDWHQTEYFMDAEQEEKECAMLIKLTSTIPYRDYTRQSNDTLGQLSKLCDWVAVGTVQAIPPYTAGWHPEIYEIRRKAGLVPEVYQIRLSVDANLYKKLPESSLTLLVSTATNDDKRRVKPGDRMLVFLTDKGYNISYNRDSSPADHCSFYFERGKNTWIKKAEGISLSSLIWSYIILDDKETEEEAIRAAKGYLSFFGENGKRDREKYVEFLCSLLNSPVKRIRYDAEADLVLFHTREKEPPPDLDKLLADDRVRDEIKDYLRFRLRNEKPKEEQE